MVEKRRKISIGEKKNPNQKTGSDLLLVRSTGLEPVLLSEHAPQTCAYADSATTACRNSKNYYINCARECQGARMLFLQIILLREYFGAS